MSTVQLERAEEKKLKSALRSVERQEEELLAELEALEKQKAEVEHAMGQPEAYSSGERMRELTRSHETNRSDHDAAMARWETLAAQAEDLKRRLTGLRP
jgi:ATP-binding cassette subfamily F protein 3